MRLTLASYREGHGFDTELPQASPESTIVFAFASARLRCTRAGFSPFEADRSALRELARRYEGAHLLGCSTGGEIVDERVNDGTISVAVAEFERTRLASHTMTAPSTPEAARAAGRHIAEVLRADDLRGILLLGAGADLHGAELASGLSDVLQTGVVVGGGLAGDGERLGSAWIVTPTGECASGVRAVALYGEHVRLGHGSQAGFHAFGPARHITRARGNVLYELDGRPALRLYKEYLGERAAGLPGSARLFPLSVRRTREGTPSLLTIRDIDEASQAMIFTGEVPEGGTAQLVRASFDRLVQGASDAASMVARPHRGSVLSLAVSNVGRRFLLRQRVDEELDAVLDVLPPGTRQVGFYSYGEFTPHAGGAAELRTLTMSLTLLSEA